MGETKQPAYTHLAVYYDQLMEVDYGHWVDYLQSLWEEIGFPNPSILELGCGTGNLTVPLKQKGYDITGVDISTDMLNQALIKSEQAGVEIPFICQDMTKLALGQEYDLALCACDGLNYILDPTQFRQVLARIAQHIRPDGLFLFDLNSDQKLTVTYGDQSYADLFDDFGYFWDNAFDYETKICTMELTFFIPTADGLYQRVIETHQQRLWYPSFVQECLVLTGWSLIGYYVFLTRKEPKEAVERWQFVAKRV